VSQSVKETVKPFTLDSLKKALQTDGRPNMTQLAKDFGISRPTLYNRLNSLVDSGEVIKNGNGYEVK
jgi:DNA-binding phage protein